MYPSGPPGYFSYIRLEDQKSANTAGGNFTSGSYQTRVLNTEVFDTGNECTLSSNVITLAAGTWYAFITCPAWLVDRHKARLQNTTDAATLLTGSNEFAPNASATRSIVTGRFTIAAGKSIEVQHRCQTTRSGDGFGVTTNFGETEIYTVAEFWRIA